MREVGNDYWWSQMPPQLCWLRRPDSLQQLLQRPVWLSKWRRDEEKRAALLWGKLPDTLIKIVLDFRDQLVRQERLAEFCRACYRHIRAHQRRQEITNRKELHSATQWSVALSPVLRLDRRVLSHQFSAGSCQVRC